MKKNISINISGIIFHIEEDGYETLRKYLDSVSKYFGSFDDSSEILADIEGRIAEIFLSRLNEGKQVINAEDVSSLIATMGSVSDFKAAEEQEFAPGDPSREQQQKSYSYSSGTIPPSKKLFRDDSRKILGGVCAGLGHYFNIDPVWPRVLFVLLTLGTGIPLVLYIVLWIALPASTGLVEEPTVKKMYRDPEKKVISGVASGIAAFFGADVTLIRLAFVLLAIFGGTGILLYIVLWIVLPEAKSITDRMQMQGEPVTLSNIESTVKKGLNEKDPEESLLAKIILFPFRALAVVIEALARVLGPLFIVLIEVLRVAIGLLFVLIGLVMILTFILMLGVFAGILTTPEWMFSDWYLTAPNFPLSSIRNSFPTWTVIFTFLAGFIPALFIMLFGSSIIAKKIVFRPAFGWSMFVLFFISVAVVSFSMPQMLYNFKEEGEFKVEESFALNGKVPVFKIRETGLDDYDVTEINLSGHEGKDIKVIERFQSQGPSRLVASENAQMVEYHVSQSDSIISFDSNITFKPDAKFRAQRIEVDVLVPYGKPFVVDAALWRLIDTDIIMDQSYYRFSLNEETQTWKITEEGMECVSCPPGAVQSANNPQDQFGLKDFNSVDLRGFLEVRIEQGQDYAVEIDGPESERRRYNVYVSGETLVVDYDDDRKYFWKNNPLIDDKVKLFITMPALRELDAMGAGKVRFNGFDEAEVDIQLTGAVMADGDLKATTLNIDLTGASFLDLHGKGKFMEASILGASSLRAYGYEVNHCIVEAHGASTAKVNVTETLEISKGIASSVSHRGSPEVIKR